MPLFPSRRIVWGCTDIVGEMGTDRSNSIRECGTLVVVGKRPSLGVAGQLRPVVSGWRFVSNAPEGVRSREILDPDNTRILTRRIPRPPQGRHGFVTVILRHILGISRVVVRF